MIHSLSNGPSECESLLSSSAFASSEDPPPPDPPPPDPTPYTLAKYELNSTSEKESVEKSRKCVRQKIG